LAIGIALTPFDMSMDLLPQVFVHRAPAYSKGAGDELDSSLLRAEFNIWGFKRLGMIP
jgi:hypothetical protein